jgi:hypothetical protein
VNNASHVRSGTGIKGRQDMGPESVLATTDEGSELQIIPWNSYVCNRARVEKSLPFPGGDECTMPSRGEGTPKRRRRDSDSETSFYEQVLPGAIKM